MPRSNNLENHRPTASLTYLAILFFCLVQNANAACTISGTASNTNIPAMLNIAIPRDTPNGSVIYTSPVVTLSNQPTLRCNTFTNGTTSNSLGQQVDPSTGLFPIGNSGLAFRWLYQGTSFSTATFPANTDLSFNTTTHGFQLVKVGPIQSPAPISGSLASIIIPGVGTLLTLSISGTIQFTQPSCTTADVNVDMGQQKISSFAGINSKLPAKPIPIHVACAPGISSMKIRLDPNTPILDNNNGVISLLNSSTAKGVGVQITNALGNPVFFGKDITLATTGTIQDMDTNFQAAYYQTESNIRPGTANTSLTFTMTYQ